MGKLYDWFRAFWLERGESVLPPLKIQPLEAQPAEAQPAEAQPIEAQPIEAQPIEPQPTETQPTETQPIEPQPTEMRCLDEKKLIADVRKLKYEINTIDDLMKISKENADLIPVLLEHLASITDEGDKEFLIRCLTVKGFNQVTEPLIQEFYQMKGDSHRWAVGNALATIADKSCSREMVEIAKNRDFGRSRQMIVYGLWKFDDPEIKDVLVSLLDDEDVVGHAIHALRMLGDPSVIKDIEPFTSYKMTWIRNEAKAAIKKLEKKKLAQAEKEKGASVVKPKK